MRVKVLPALVGAAITGLVIAVAPATASASAADPTYYVSLGDSLAAGYQPNTNQNEPVSYTDDLFTTLKASEPTLEHIRLGCSGETTETMINGGKCAYPGATSQLDAATRFLAAHKGKVKYVTEDIGANDIYRCVSSGAPDIGCITQGLNTIRTNLTKINGQLHDAGGTEPVYVGMTYYTPTLASWLSGPSGKAVAVATAGADNLLGATITGANSGVGWKTADVATAFSNNDFGNPVDVPGLGSLPHNVAQICLWTWMCTSYKDIHANPTGHQVIAKTFLPLLTKPGGGGSSGS
ncbi:hypothetical protein GCM10023094_39740 [Rhodococcus olei]|uniref:SGNH hydrolase-type esterase domain-containing protein n=1 Tax=Rhodococcus olei TaxID=2161675 RepID=A0ABP8PEA7_9NOCA